MKDQRLEIKDIVKYIDDATLGKLDIPEFQRAFVWSPDKAKRLVDSLWRGYPIGTILLWESKYSSPRVARGNQTQRLWVVDGQQRITTLSLLFGKKPYWWGNAGEWNKYYEKYDVLVDVSKPKDSLEFGLPNPVRKKSSEWISVRSVLICKDDEELSKFAIEIAERTGHKLSEVHGKLQSIKKIESYPLYEIIIDHEIEDVAEIFTRLNMAGVKVRESDVIIALVAAKQQGWVREEFNPFLKSLEDKGFEIDPAILIRSLAVIGKGMARLKDIPENFWEKSEDFQKGWEKTKASVSFVIRKMYEIGILSSDLLPSHNALIPLFVLHSKFGAFNFKKALYWFLLATGDGRYSGSAITALDQDVKSINESSNFDDAISVLLEPLHIPVSFTKDDFLKDYRDEFLRLVLYLVIFNKEAKDWLYQDIRIGYDRSDNKLNEGFKPEWHHFFPTRVLKKQDIDDSKIDILSNIVILNEKANRTFTSKEPTEYLKVQNVKMERLIEQIVPTDENLWRVSNYDKFLERRASDLADEVNKWMEELKNG
ncbi:MAG: DUF262 domain-containing protein [Candidatus Omnitrophica bacterium]|nr:DUF262 domain-containing protein [Candidatus Omnitrophota bacterium]